MLLIAATSTSTANSSNMAGSTFLFLVVGLVFLSGIAEGEEVEKITKILTNRLNSGSCGSPDMYTSVGQNVLVALNP